MESFPQLFCNVTPDGFSKLSSNPFSSVPVLSLSGEERSHSDCTSLTAMSAVGCDASMGLHLERAAAAWSSSSANGRVSAQLEKTGLGKSEREEIEERILEVARRYDNKIEL